MATATAPAHPPPDPPAGRFPGWRHSKGYIELMFRAPGSRQRVYLHRLVAWHFSSLGDLSGLDVHHRNGNGADNRPENLEIFGHGEHRHQHSAKPRQVQACQVCGKIFFQSEPPRPRRPGTHCSRACAADTARKRRWARGASNCLQ